MKILDLVGNSIKKKNPKTAAGDEYRKMGNPHTKLKRPKYYGAYNASPPGNTSGGGLGYGAMSSSGGGAGGAGGAG